MLGVAKKYILVFEKDKEKDVLKLMQKDWFIEFADKNEVQEEIQKELQKINYAISSFDFAISYLLPYAPQESILKKIKTPKIIIKKSDLDNFSKQEHLKTSVEKIVKAEKDLKVLEKENKEQGEKLKELEQFGSLTFIPKETVHTFSVVVKIEKKNKELFNNFCFSEKIFAKEIKDNIYVVIGLKEIKERFLKETKAEIIAYGFNKIPIDEQKIILQKLEENKQKENSIKKELEKTAGFLDDFKICYDIFCLKKRQIEFEKRSFKSKFLNYILFFAPEKEKIKFEKELNKISNNFRIIEINLKKDEIPPVYIENKGIIEPFESVTDIFGLPGSMELDPTPYLAFFFIVFFGICITDAAYGLLLVLFTGLPLILFKERFKKNKLIKLLFFGGISTFLTGVLFGSYFGVGPEELGIPFMKRFKIIDPIKDTVLFMALAFFLGYVQICFSQMVKIIKGKKNNNKEEILSGFAWLGFYISAGVYLLSLKFAFLNILGSGGLLLSGIGLFLVESKGQKIFLKPLVGAVKILQGLIGTMSDILSYSRLMALGLGTGVIALIVNQIAFLLGTMIPYVGWIIAVFVLIGGHIFNLGINALGGFIHSARLQFVEFFPKFMEGGGRRLDPLGQELKYIQINN